LETLARYQIDLSTAAGVAALTLYLDGVGGTVTQTAIDAYKPQIDNGIFNLETDYVNTVPSLIENTYMNGINSAGNFLYQQTGF
jgi:hypothetical protein